MLEDMVGQDDSEASTIQWDQTQMEQIGCVLPFSAGHDEPGRFASVLFGEAPL
jgi:hypothetical protein